MDRSSLLLYELSKCMKKRSDSFSISSAEFGRCIGASQQTASRLLNELEKKGFISCSRGGKGQVISLTKKGVSALDEMLLNLRSFLECSRESLSIEAKVVAGFGEGAYYVRAYEKKLGDALGFVPYPGTLNLRPLRPYPPIEGYASGEIPGFSEGDRSFGAVKYVLAKLSSKSWSEDCFILIPKRTHHTGELEVVSREKLRDKYGVRDGDLLTLTVCA